MVEQMKNVMIALFIIAATMIVIFILLFLNPAAGDRGQILKIRFADIDKVSIGTRVTFGGRPIGEVVDIIPLYQVGDPREIRGDIVYLYEVRVRADSSVRVYNTDEVYLRTSGLLGEKSIEINPLGAKPDEEPILLNDKIIYAKEVGSVEQTFQEFKDVAEKFDIALTQLSSMVQEIRDKQVIDKISDTFSNLVDITASLNNPEFWSETLDHVHTISQNIVNSWDTVDETLNTVNEVADNLLTMSESGKEIVATVQNGEGTLGRIIMRDDLYLELASVLSKAGIAMNDVNQYGILFHTDKRWQRESVRRRNVYQKLSNPDDFRVYFQEELAKINASLTKTHLLLEEEKGLCPSPSFDQAYLDLLKRVERLQETLNLYNQERKDMQRCQ